MKKKKVLSAAVITTSIALMVITLVLGCDILGLEDGFGRVGLTVQGTVPGGLTARELSATARAADPVTAQIAVKTTSGTQIGVITITDARIAIKDIEFDMFTDDADTAVELAANESIEFEGPFIVDLLANTSTPEISTADLLPGRYTEIEMDIDKIQDNDLQANPDLLTATDPLFENSIYLEGSYTGATADGDVTAAVFKLSYDLDEEFELPIADPNLSINVQDRTFSAVIIAFRLNKWFSFSDTETNPESLDFRSLSLSSSQIVLDKDSSGANDKIRKVIKDNIKKSADLGEDDDDDGILDSSEDEDPDSEDGDDS